MKTRIDIIRHGEPVGGRRYRGHGVDDPLTDKGWRQMWDAMPQNPQWDHIVSSPLSRCLDFATALSEKLAIESGVDDDFREIGFGVWEGLTPDEITARDPDALERFLDDPINNRPEGAEPLQDFSARVCNAYNRVVEHHRGRRVLVVAHAGVARAITAHVLGLELKRVYSRFRIEYGGILTTTVETGKAPKLVIESR
jgi:alpha-ribazole phosphatase